MGRMGRLQIGVIACLLLVVGVVIAQEVLQCDELIEDFLEELDENCSDFDLNQACYGTNLVTAEFLNPDDLPQDYFTEPSDIAEVLQMSNLSTDIFNPEVPEWGIAVLNVQANIPNTIPGQAVKVLLMGAMEMENSVEPDEAFISERSVQLTVGQNSIVRYFPRTDSDFVQSIPAGAEVLADALSTNRLWVRVAYDAIPGWIAVNSLDEASQERLVALPMIAEDARSPMQAFYFETGVSQSDCRNAPTTLVVQGPENYAVDIVANGAEIRIDSTIVLRTNISPGEDSAVMEVITLSGEARVFPDTENEIVVPAGEILVSCLTTEEQDLGIDDRADDREVLACESRELTAEEIAAFNYIRRVSSGVLNYEVEWPPAALLTPTPTSTELVTETPIATLQPTAVSCEPRTDWTGVHTVTSGQTLSGIASSYRTDMFTLADANCLSNPDLILPGQELRVPFIPTQTPASIATSVPAGTAPPLTTADVRITFSISDGNPLENETVTLTITATNTSPADTVNSLVVMDMFHTLAARFVFGAPNVSTGTYDFASGTWTIPSLAPNGTATVTMAATVRPTAAGAAVPVQVWRAASSPTDTNGGNDTVNTMVNIGYGNIIVTSTSEAIANDGVCTLREAMLAANSDTASGNAIGECRTGNGADTIILQAAGPYNVTSFYSAEAGIPNVTSDITLNGNGNTIQATGVDYRLFHVVSSSLTINALTVQDFMLTNGFGGAAILSISNSTIAINNSTFIDNHAVGQWSLAFDDSTVSIIGSTITNSNAGFTGQVAFVGTATNATVSGTTIDGQNIAFFGLWSLNAATVTINASTITNHIDSGFSVGNGGTVTVTNSTLAGNGDDCSNDGGTINGSPTNTSPDPDCL